MCFDLFLGLLFGWWAGSEIKKTRDFQEQMLERLPDTVEAQEPEVLDVTIETDDVETTWINGFMDTFRNRIGRAPTNQETWLAQWTFRLYQAGEDQITRDQLFTPWPWERQEIWGVLRALRAAGYDPFQPEEGAYEVDAEH